MTILEKHNKDSKSLKEEMRDKIHNGIKNHIEENIDPRLSEFSNVINERIDPKLNEVLEKFDTLTKTVEHVKETVDPFIIKITEQITKTIDPFIMDIVNHINEQIDPRIILMGEHLDKSVDKTLVTMVEHVTKTIDPTLETVVEHITKTIDPRIETISEHITKTIDPNIETINEHITKSIDPNVIQLNEKMKEVGNFIDDNMIPLLEGNRDIKNLPTIKQEKSLEEKVIEGSALINKVDEFLNVAQKQKVVAITEERAEPFLKFLTTENKVKFTMLPRETKYKIQERLVEVKPMSEADVLKVWESITNPTDPLDELKKDMKECIPPMLKETFDALPLETQTEILENARYYNLTNRQQKEQYFYQQSILTEGLKTRTINNGLVASDIKGNENLTPFQIQQRQIVESIKRNNELR